MAVKPDWAGPKKKQLGKQKKRQKSQQQKKPELPIEDVEMEPLQEENIQVDTSTSSSPISIQRHPRAVNYLFPNSNTYFDSDSDRNYPDREIISYFSNCFSQEKYGCKELFK